MKRLNLAYYALSVGAAAALLAGCGGSQPPIGAPGATRQARVLAARGDGSHYKLLYSFAGSPDGSKPQASLIDVRGTLYGTTVTGGAGSCTGGTAPGCGTVFSITTGGTEHVLYSFGSLPDGEYPHARLRDVGGTLYGTTGEGGSYGTCGYSSYYYSCGTVFSVTTSGIEKVVHSFGPPPDGSTPWAGLIDVKGTLYATTSGGGALDCGYPPPFIGCGTVFSITPSGTENVVFQFRGGRGGTGWSPYSGLIEVGGVLYGTTYAGGRYLAGTVFSVTAGGTYNLLHSFGKGADGIGTFAGLTRVKGTLYGTTSLGGQYGQGTVFSITLQGTEKVLHSFGNGTDGRAPGAGLIDVNGTLYGTTSEGGAYSCGSTTCGTVFSITPDGKEKVLHSFGNGTDGRHPNADLIDVNGVFYGTTSNGGASGRGTVFAWTPLTK